MKNPLYFLLFTIWTTGISAQDLNLSTPSKQKIRKKASERKISLELNTSATYIPKLPSIESSYTAYTYDAYAAKPVDTITTISSDYLILQQKNLSNNLLYNFGLSFKYRINKHLYLGISPRYSIYKPKVPHGILFDDQSIVASRPQCDTLIFLKPTNFISLPIFIGLKVNNNLSFEIGAEYLMSTSSLPKSTKDFEVLNQSFLYPTTKNLNSLIPISGMIALNYRFVSNFTLNVKCNYGVAFYIPNNSGFSSVQHYNVQNVQNPNRQYYLYVNPNSQASVSNFSISTGLSFSF